MPLPPLPIAEEMLRPLLTCITAIEHLLDAQPDLATVMDAQLRQAFSALNPDSVFLNEYVYDSTSTQGHDSLSLYLQALAAFWSAPHASTGALSVLEAVSQQQRVMFALEADLQLLDARQQLTLAEQAHEKKPGDAQAQTAVASLNARLKTLTEGRQLIENRILHETSNNATPPQTVSITLYSTASPDGSTSLNGCFILTEHLHGPRPTVLYTPQFGVEIFEHFSAMENVLRRRLVSGDDKTLLLANVAQRHRAQASETLRDGQYLRYTPITGPVFSACLHAQLDQQQADIEQAFSASNSTFDALATKVRSCLALPLKGSPGVLARLPEALARVEPRCIGTKLPNPRSP